MKIITDSERMCQLANQIHVAIVDLVNGAVTEMDRPPVDIDIASRIRSAAAYAIEDLASPAAATPPEGPNSARTGSK